MTRKYKAVLNEWRYHLPEQRGTISLKCRISHLIFIVYKHSSYISKRRKEMEDLYASSHCPWLELIGPGRNTDNAGTNNCKYISLC